EMNWRNGAEHGRIWRISRRDVDSSSVERRSSLSSESSVELVNLLSHPVAWWRLTAQRLLVERQDRELVLQLRKVVAESKSPLARLHAMYVLDGLDANGAKRPSGHAAVGKDSESLDIESLRRALRDSDANIRRHAVRLAASHAERSNRAEVLRNDLLQMD